MTLFSAPVPNRNGRRIFLIWQGSYMWFKKKTPAEGNWEERGVIGTRIEISGSRLLILWRNLPVLDTRFRLGPPDGTGKRVLTLESSGLRYPDDAKDYAQVTEISLQGDKLCFKEDFPITGPSRTDLERVEHSRYGNYVISDKAILPLLRGTWESDDGYCAMTFSGDRMTYDERVIRIHVLRDPSGSLRIVDADPAKMDQIAYFSRLEFFSDRLVGTVPVCDAPSHTVTLKKK